MQAVCGQTARNALLRYSTSTCPSLRWKPGFSHWAYQTPTCYSMTLKLWTPKSRCGPPLFGPLMVVNVPLHAAQLGNLHDTALMVVTQKPTKVQRRRALYLYQLVMPLLCLVCISTMTSPGRCCLCLHSLLVSESLAHYEYSVAD